MLCFLSFDRSRKASFDLHKQFLPSYTMSGVSPDDAPRKQVVWDEHNLAANEEYRRLNPVLMKIDEPKTPYCHDEGSLDEDEHHHEEGVLKDGTWDPQINYLARRVKNETPMVRVEVSAPPSADATGVDESKKRRRPQLLVQEEHDLVTQAHEVEKRQHDAEFQAMRKAVYAEEGLKFKQLLHKTVQDDDDDDEE
jgi:hypothetical protein